jgi:hypothetical protein
MADPPPYPGAPRWVKVSGIVIGVLILLFVGLMVGGGAGHGPGRHASPSEADGHGRWGLLILLGVLVLAGAALNWSWLVGRGLSRRGESSVRRWPLWLRTARVPMNMTPRLRKLVLTAHVTSSVGSLGAVAVFLALALVGLASQDAQMVRAAYIANGLIAWYIILPLIVTSLLIGLVQSLSTPWGLFRHYWVLAKLMLTIVTLYILLTQMDGISYIAGVAAETTLSGSDLLGLRRSMRTHATGGLVVLLMLVAFSIYKPQGMTRYGWRKELERRALLQP